MSLTKNRFHQSIFYFLISLLIVFNGFSNYDLFIQINFILISLFFLICFKDINYKAHIKKFFLDNRIILIIYFIFLSYIIFQIVLIPIELLKFFSPAKYKILIELGQPKFFSTISLDPSKTFFNFLNYFSLFLYFLIFKIIFYKEIHLLRFYLYILSAGFISSLVGVYFFLIGNPDFLFISNSSYASSATGFFINRTVFACFLNLSFLAGIEYLSLIDNYSKKKIKFFYRKVYVRLFLLFITIGIITSSSKIGNFLFFVIILCYLIKFLFNKNKSKYLAYTLLVIILFDIFILGFYFGGTKLLERFYFLQDDLSNYIGSLNNFDSLKRADIARFSLNQFFQFKFFGYGVGTYEIIFKVFNNDNSFFFANHAHSDIIEFLGELGVLGFSILCYLLLKILKKINLKTTKNIFLIIYLITLLIFDFSFHIFLIQLIFILLISLNIKKTQI